MPLDIYFYIALNTLVPIALSVILITIPLILIYFFVPPKPPLQLAIFIIVFGLLGAVIGVLTGSSRESVVGSVLPAILTLITTFLTFSFTSEGLKPVRPVIPYCLLALLLTSVYWVYIGSKIRTDAETSKYYVQRRQEELRFERVDLELEKAQKCKAAGLPLPSFTVNAVVTPPKLPELPTPSKP
jgi:hypothetical protein